MKQPAASPGRAEKQQLPAPPGLARLLLSKSRRGARSRRAPATSPMFVFRGRSAGGRAAAAAAGADGEPSSPKVTCIGQVRMRKGKGKKGKKGAAAAVAVAGPKASTPEKARGYCRCLKKAFLCGGLFDFDRRRRRKAPSPEVERSRRSPWVFSSMDVAVAATPKPPDPRRDRGEEEDEDEMEVGVGVFGSVERDEAEELGINGGDDDKEDGEGEAAELVSSATTTPPKNALLLMRCRSAPQNRASPLTSRFATAAPSLSPTKGTVDFAVELPAAPARASPSPRKPEKAAPERDDEKWQEAVAAQEQEKEAGEEEEEDDDDDDEEEMRCSSARPLVLPRCKSEPATTAAAKMAAGTGPEGTSSGCFWANGGSSGRRRHAPAPATAAPVSLTGH